MKSARQTLLLALLLLAGLDALAAWGFRSGRLGQPWARARERWEELEDCGGQPRWLLIGDSTADADLSVKNLAPALGAPVIMLASVGDFTLLNSLWMVERYVERWGAPAGVILAQVPRAWAVGTPVPLIAQAVPLDWDALSRLDPPLSPWTEAGLAALEARWLPLWAFGEDIAFSLLGRPPLDPAPARRPVIPSRIARINRLAFERLLALAERKGFDVYVVVMPVNRDVYNVESERVLREAVVSELARAAKRSPRLKLISGLPPWFPPELMRDHYHLLPTRRGPFSRLLTAALAAQAGSAALRQPSARPAHRPAP